MINRIKIISCEVVEDNWGRASIFENAKDIMEYLIYPIDWTDDVTFKDSGGNIYLIDDLNGKEVEVGNKVFGIDTVNEDVWEIDKI